jgi:hypothetical protein
MTKDEMETGCAKLGYPLLFQPKYEIVMEKYAILE